MDGTRAEVLGKDTNRLPAFPGIECRADRAFQTEAAARTRVQERMTAPITKLPWRKPKVIVVETVGAKYEGMGGTWRHGREIFRAVRGRDLTGVIEGT